MNLNDAYRTGEVVDDHERHDFVVFHHLNVFPGEGIGYRRVVSYNEQIPTNPE